MIRLGTPPHSSQPLARHRSKVNVRRLLPVVPALLAAAWALCPAPAQAQQAPTLDVVINEIAWMGTTTSANDEWIELFNNTGGDISLIGWTLTALDGTPAVTLSGTIPAGGHFLLERTDDSTVPGVTADQIYTGALGNTGEVLALNNQLGELQDDVNAWYAGNNTTKATMQRVNPLVAGTVSSNWTNGPVGGTPENSGGSDPGCPPPQHTVDCQPAGPFVFFSAGPVVINEVMINPSAVADGVGEFVELYNSGGTSVDIQGWTLRDDDFDSYTVPSGSPVVLAPGAFFVIAASANSGLNGGFTADLVWTGFALSNSGDEVVLVDALGAEQDRLVYTGTPFTDTAGRSLERVSPRLPTSDPLSWSAGRTLFGSGDLGTPRAVNTLQARRYLLSGTLVTMDETLPVPDRVFTGTLYVQGNRIIDVLHDADPVPAYASGAVAVNTRGLIFPGLMNIHDHIGFNTIPHWDVPALMHDVSDWTSLDDYRRHVRYVQDILIGSNYYDLLPEVGKYAEVKALAAGTTAEQGSFPTSPGFTNHLARNVDLTNFGADRIRQRALSVLDSTFQTTEAPGLVADMDAGQVDAWLVHLGEGTSGDAPQEFQVLEDVCLLRSETAVIHGTALTPAQLDKMAAAGSKLIIAPTSNYLYYGATADVPGAVQRGIPVSLSTDWSPAGDKNLLASLKSLSLINDTVWGSALTDLQMVEMVTTSPARTLNWCGRAGALRPGMFADLAVILGDPASPYRSLIEATEEDVVLTVVDGDPLYGRPEFLERLTPGEFEVVTSGCGFTAGLDVTDPTVPDGQELFSEIAAALSAASALDFQHMKANFHDPAVAGMTDQQFQTYLDTNFPLGIVPSALDPVWVIDDTDYFDGLRNETNVSALNPAATLDTEFLWDSDSDGVANACGPVLLRSGLPQGLLAHIDNLVPTFVDDDPGTLTDGQNYFYLVDERGSPTVTITLEARPAEDTVRIHFEP
ncbi:MAG TPA: lamin tail domain-containing protein [Candidatus Polarisedimenticolia bacterium]|nr:lamin tail domain-containing protein [Candidatus Polarisedimenticolia bacterium]